jgi:hypothetical protein
MERALLFAAAWMAERETEEEEKLVLNLLAAEEGLTRKDLTRLCVHNVLDRVKEVWREVEALKQDGSMDTGGTGTGPGADFQ